jgi:hypothetical protein
MKLEPLITRLIKSKEFIARFAVIIFIVSVALVFGFLTFEIAHYSNREPNQDQVDERLSSLKTVKLDSQAVQKIEQLQDQNIGIDSLFNNGRANPFE